MAQCAPTPAQSNQPVICGGTTAGGYTLNSDQSPLTVTAGSSLQNSTGDALTVAIPANSFYDPRTIGLTINGSVSSSTGIGIHVYSGPSDGSDPDYYGTSGSIKIGAGGSVTGVTGITIAQSPGYLTSNAPVHVSVDNFGTITGTGGVALTIANTNGFNTPSYDSITNEMGGTIGAISASFFTLTNNGTIDGGSLSAVASPQYGNADQVTNTGMIQAEGAADTVTNGNYSMVNNSGTIANTGSGAATSVGQLTNVAGGIIEAAGSDVVKANGNYGNVTVVNSGTIANLGTGQAISGFNVDLTNNAGGLIGAGGGGVAINAVDTLRLVNLGTINGNVLAGSSALYGSTSYVDTSQGIINGNLFFGTTSNTLIATAANGALQTGVTGTIIFAPGSTGTIEVAPTADATLSNALALPTGFTQLSLNPGAGTTLTLANGFAAPGTINFNGNGTLAVTGSLSSSGQIIGQTTYNSSGTLNISGSITSTNASGPVAISLNSGYGSIINSGAITASGDAINFVGTGISNSGSITAGGTAISANVNNYNAGFSNTGTITSTGGTAVSLSQSCTCLTSTNSGTISGSQIGLQLFDGIFINSGSVISSGYGIALQYYGAIENQAGGVITGGTAAIGALSGTPGISSVSNAGTINGNVNLANGGFSTNTYTALAGGVLNGNLTLGVGDTLVTDLANSGSGGFSGINGTVTANRSNLVYTVKTSATTSPAAPAGFSLVAYALTDNPTLTIAGDAKLNATLGLAGTGSVIITEDIATTDAVAVQTQANVNGVPNNPGQPAPAIALTNNGSISATAVTPYSGAQAAVELLGGSDTLVNNGTISLTNTSGTGNANDAAVAYAQSVTNAGTISGTGAAAVLLSGTLTNTGSISSDQTAIIVQNSGSITNSGTINSTGGAAIGGLSEPYYYAYATPQISNLAGGAITGNGDAIDVQGGSISNAGVINGNVNLAFANNGYAAIASGNYIDAGGTLNGNLTLGASDTLVVNLAGAGNGPLGGVTGTINANGAALINNVSADTTTTGAGSAAGFGAQIYRLTNNAALTLATGAGLLTDTVGFAGTGTVIIDAPVGTIDQTAIASQPAIFSNGIAPAPDALAITTNSVITETVDDPHVMASTVSLGNADTLTNNGTISFVDAASTPLVYFGHISAVSGGQSITNAGTISATGAPAVLLNDNATATPQALTNSGTISSDQAAVVVEADGLDTITNSGTISGQYGIALNGSATINNSGTVTGSASGILLALFGSGSIANSGTISSFAGPAISGTPYSIYFGTITNLSGGVISGVGTGGSGDAIDLSGGTVINSGTINGNVNFASGNYDFASSTYIAKGGTLTGNLTFGPNGTLIVIGNSSGITGTITGGDTYAQGFTASTSVDLTTLAMPTGFSAVGIGAIGTGTTVTVTGPAAGVMPAPSYFGDGTIINTVDIHGASIGPGVTLGQANAALGLGGLNFVNSAAIDPGVSGAVASFSNSGTVGTASLGYGAVQLTAIGPEFTFTNSGTIASALSSFFITSSVSIGANANLNSATINNSGLIANGLYASFPATTISVTNSGELGSPGGLNAALTVYAAPLAVAPGADPSTTSLTLANTATATLQGGISVGGPTQNLTVSNAGLVDGSIYVFQDRAGSVNPATPTNYSDQISASLTNSGAVSGNLFLSAAAASASLTNSGSVVQTVQPNYQTSAGATLSDMTTGNSTVTATNSGTLTTSTGGTTGLSVTSAAGDSSDPTSVATTVLTVTNSGTMTASGGSLYNPGYGSLQTPYFYSPPQLALSAGLAVLATGTGGASASITNAAGGSITASGGTVASSFYDPSVVPAALAASGPVGLIVQADAINIVNAGTITGGPDIAVPAGTNVSFNNNPISPLTPVIAGGIEAYGATITFTNAAGGVVNGDVDLAAISSATVVNQGVLGGNVTFGAGNVSFTQSLGGTLGGTVTGGSGSNTLSLDITGGGTLSQTLLNSFVNFAAPQIIGSGIVTTTGPLALSSLVLNGANLTLAAGSTLQTAGPVAITAGTGTSTFTNYGTVDGGIVDVATTNAAGGTINIATDITTTAPITNLSLGTVAISGAALTVGGAGFTNAGTLLLDAGSTLSAAALTNSGTVTNSGIITAPLIDNQAGGTLATSGTINSVTSLSNEGTLAATGTITVPMLVDDGTLNLTGALTLNGTLVVNAGGMTDLGGNIATITHVILAGGTLQNGTLNSASGIASNGGTVSGVTGPTSLSTAAGTTILTGNNSYTGSTNVLGGTLTASSANAFSAGSVTTVNSGGTLDLGGLAQTIATVNLTGGTLQNGSLTGAVTSSGGTVSGIKGTSSVTAIAGTTTLSGTNGYSGGTLVSTGVLAVASAQALGTGGLILKPGTQLLLAGNGFTIPNPITLAAPGDPTITVTSGNSDTLSGVISGPGALTVSGGGTLVLNAINSYTGATTVAASNLVVNGSIASSASLTLSGGGTLSGNGAIGALNVAAGARFAPGTGTATGQLRVGGNLTFASGSVYAVSVNSTSSTSVAVSGTATLTGATVLANVAAGHYVVNKYTIVTASDGLGGTTFAGLDAVNLPTGIQDTLSYDADHVYLNLTGLLDGGATTGLPGNQQAVTNAINAYFNSGGAVPTSYLGLSGLSGAPLAQAMASLSGELPTGAAAVAEQVANSFLGDMLDPFADGRRAACENISSSTPGAGPSGQPSCGFAPRLTVWAMAVGGYRRLDGDPAGAGTHRLTSDTFGAASGFDFRIGPGATLGIAVAGGRAQWSLPQGLGDAHSDYFEIGANGAVHLARAYLSGALAYGWHAMATRRTVFGTDTLTAAFHAHDFGGRIEAGLHLGAISPYGAFQTQRVSLPGFAEGDSGAGSYALAYGGRRFTAAAPKRAFASMPSFLPVPATVLVSGCARPMCMTGSTIPCSPPASFRSRERASTLPVRCQHAIRRSLLLRSNCTSVSSAPFSPSSMVRSPAMPSLTKDRSACASTGEWVGQSYQNAE